MIKIDEPLPGLALFETKVYHDERGFFLERYRADKLAEAGVHANFVQANHSRSAPHVLRGLHYQTDPAQGKLISCLRGAIFDVVVDLRRNAPTYGRSFHVELTGENGRFLWVPYGFAHGLCVTSTEHADVMYQVDGYYNPRTEGGIRWDDPELTIPWPTRNPIVSARDAALASFRETKPL